MGWPGRHHRVIKVNTKDILPHWLWVLLGAGSVSIPFQLYAAFQCGSLNRNATPPFIYYPSIVTGVNLAVVGAYVMAASYPATGLAVASAGLLMAAIERIKLSLRYRRNPQYHWRLLKSP